VTADADPTGAVVELVRVQARDAAGREGRPRGSLAGASLALDAGVHAFLGAPEDGTLALVDVLTGARRPLRGRVAIVGKDPWRTPALRARIGALAVEPRLPDARTVREAVALATRARREQGDRFDAVAAPLGLVALADRAPRSLAFAEERAVELALALSTPSPVLLVLHEPFADVAGSSRDLLAARVAEVAASGACVVITTSSPKDARALADHVVVLRRGLVAQETKRGAALGADPTVLRAWIGASDDGEGARELCAALALRPEVLGVSFEAGEADEGGAGIVDVRGASAEATALALVDAAVEVGVHVQAIREIAPSLGEVRAATDALSKRAQRPASPPSPALPPAAPQPALPPSVEGGAS
jgi:ABC-2 type transport system ATP-binding protein